MEAFTKDPLAVGYKYNDQGIRTQKTINGAATDYVLNGTQILAEKTGENRIDYMHDGNGKSIAIRFNGAEYYYVTNIQGDILLNYILFNIHYNPEKEMKKYGIVFNNDIYYRNGELWSESPLIPYYSEAYWCLTRIPDAPFDFLWETFTSGTEDEMIGAISKIAFDYPKELQNILCRCEDRISEKMQNLFCLM